MSNMSRKLKISSTAYRVLLLLQKLNEKKLSTDRLNRIFSEDPYVARFFSKDVILKYISTLRMAGFSITKPSASNDYCYVLNKAPVQIDFSEEEIKTLRMLKSFAQSFQQKKFLTNYYSFVEKLKRYMNEEQIKKLNEEFAKKTENQEKIKDKFKDYGDLIKKIEQYIVENQRVEIKYRTKQDEQEKIAVTKLQKIKYHADSVKLLYYDLVSGQMNTIKINDITNIKQLPSISGEKQLLNPVIFKIKGRLAKAYRPYEKEKLTDPDLKTGEITVTSYTDDMEVLLRRLLKYGENCEVLYPKQVRNKMINFISRTLENYKENVTQIKKI